MKERKEHMFDEAVRGALEYRAARIEASEEGAARLCRKIDNRIEEETRMRGKWNWKKAVTVAAAVCVLGSITAVASGRIVSVTSHSYHDEEVTDYKEMEKLAEEQGISLKAPEAFANGYQFASAVPVYGSGEDESGNTVGQWESLSLTYRKEGGPDLFLDADKTQLQEFGEADQTFEYEGITMSYAKEHYRMVPPDYQVTEEEQDLIESGGLVISYGTDTVQDQEYQILCWEDGGVSYSLSAFDSGMTAQEMARMAQEMIEMP